MNQHNIRLRISLSLKRGEAILPSSYQSYLATALRALIPLDTCLYSISGLWLGKPFRYQGDRLHLSQSTSLDVGMYQIDAKYDFEFFQKKLSDAEIIITDQERIQDVLVVSEIRQVKPPTFEPKMQYATISPLLIRYAYEQQVHQSYLHPVEDAELFEKMVIESLYAKCANYFEEDDSIYDFENSFRVLSEPVQRLVSLKIHNNEPIKVKCYVFDFELITPPALQEIAFFSGLGSFNQLGLGAIRHKPR